MITTIISDLHIGSRICQSKRLLRFLECLKTDRLIINGDLIDHSRYEKYSKEHLDLLYLLQNLYSEVILVKGNHDEPAGEIAGLIGAKLCEEFIFDDILILHDHQFDTFIDKHPIITMIGDLIYGGLQFIEPSHNLARFAKRKSKLFIKCEENVKQKSLKYGLSKNCRAIITGHTHFPRIQNSCGILYVNCGSWTEKPCSYVEIKDGDIELKYYA